MPIATKPFSVLICAAALAAGPASAQHAHSSSAAPSPYAGQQTRPIKALSDKDIEDLLKGAGMGFAKAAELNRYPGPMHALEHGSALNLSPAQQEALQQLMHGHKSEARTLGARVVALERELDGVFASGRATAGEIDRILAQLGEATARLRGSHLKTHLETTRLLTPEQVDRYVQLRGYAAASGERHRH